MEKNVLCGEKIAIGLDSLGLQLYSALCKNGQADVLIDAFTGKTIKNEELLYNAHYLADSIQNYGLTQKDVIGVYSENCLEFFEPVLAALFLGIPFTGFSSHYTIDELQHTANLSKPKLIFCSKETIPIALKACAGLVVKPTLVVMNTQENYKNCLSLQNFVSIHITKDFNINKSNPVQLNVKERVAFILYSSGTTGLPKGVMITHFNINAIIAIAQSSNYLSVKDPIVGLIPFYHAYGLLVTLFRIMSNSKIVVMKKFDPHVYLQAIERYKVTYLTLVPSLAHFLSKTELLDKFDLTSVKIVASGGSVLPKSTELAVSKKFNVPHVRQSYGLTEATLGVIGYSTSTYRHGSCGHILPNMSVKIMDEDTGEALPAMQRGELCCRGPLIMKGYINDPKSTENIVNKEGWLHTGDIAYYDNEGYFYIVDRIKDLIKYRSFQVPPAELESILLTHPEIQDAGVIGLPDDKDGEHPFAFVVKTQKSTLMEKDVQNFVNKKVSIHKRLRGGVLFIQEIPRNPSGKVLRRILRQRLTDFKSKL